MDPDAKYQEIEQLEKEIDKLTIIERIKALDSKYSYLYRKNNPSPFDTEEITPEEKQQLQTEFDDFKNTPIDQECKTFLTELLNSEFPEKLSDGTVRGIVTVQLDEGDDLNVQVEQSAQGAKIISMDAKSALTNAGVHVKDMIVSINNKPCANLSVSGITDIIEEIPIIEHNYGNYRKLNFEVIRVVDKVEDIIGKFHLIDFIQKPLFRQTRSLQTKKSQINTIKTLKSIEQEISVNQSNIVESKTNIKNIITVQKNKHVFSSSSNNNYVFEFLNKIIDSDHHPIEDLKKVIEYISGYLTHCILIEDIRFWTYLFVTENKTFMKDISTYFHDDIQTQYDIINYIFTHAKLEQQHLELFSKGVKNIIKTWLESKKKN